MRAMRRFKSMLQAQRFARVHAAVSNLFNLDRHLVALQRGHFGSGVNWAIPGVGRLALGRQVRRLARLPGVLGGRIGLLLPARMATMSGRRALAHPR